MDNNENILNVTISGKNMIKVKNNLLCIAVSVLFSSNAFSALYVEQDSASYGEVKNPHSNSIDAIIYSGKYTGDTKPAEIKKIEKQKFFYDIKKADSKPAISKVETAKIEKTPFIKEPSKTVVTAEPIKPVFVAKSVPAPVPQYQSFTFNKGRLSAHLKTALANKKTPADWNLVWKSGIDYEITVPFTVSYKTPFELVHKLKSLYNFNYKMFKDNKTTLIYDK